MAAPQSAAKILMAGGGLAKSGAKDPLCKAFNDAAADWCADHKKYEAAKKANGGKAPPGATPPGPFNDRFYSKLTSQNPAPPFLAGMEREVPALFQGGRAVGGGIGAVGNIAGVPAQKTARAMTTRMGNLAKNAGAVAGPMGGLLVTGVANAGNLASRLQGRLYKYWDKFLSKAFRPRFFDGVLPGPPPRVLEIKGPTDSFNTKHGPGQAADLRSLKPRTAVVSCKACKSPSCTTSAGGGQSCN